jgi:hypothetical protein
MHRGHTRRGLRLTSMGIPRSVKRQRKSKPPPTPPVTEPAALAPPAIPWWLYLGPALLFTVACAHGMLEVHSSNDTWIALAAGRDIFSQPTFPLTDSWTYTFAGQMWFNQNWLSHVYFWLLYDFFGPNWVIYGTWALCVGTFTFVLLATWMRCQSLLAATLAASVVAIACRDWLSARPATIQFFLLALLWCCLTALMTQRPQHRWWPIALLAPIFGVWTHAHGSFVFGYGLVVMFLGAAVVPLLFRRRPVIDRPQAIAIVVIIAVTALLGALLSPYGFENYTHPLKVAQSEVFRRVGEWVPPYKQLNRFPRVERFWIALSVAAIAPIIALLLRLVAPRDTSTSTRHRAADRRAPINWHVALLDVAAITLGLYMAFFARRFAPIFYVLATPALVTGVLHITRGVSALWRAWTRRSTIFLAWAAFAVTAFVTGRSTYHDLSVPESVDSPPNVLSRVTRNYANPEALFEFLHRNQLSANVFCEWTVAGPLTFFAPSIKTFIDGRSQQVFTVSHFLTYTEEILQAPDNPAAPAARILADAGTEAALLRPVTSARRLRDHLDRDPNWTPAIRSMRGLLYLRRDSALLNELVARERRGELWWPDTPVAEVSRGRLLITTRPYDTQRALQYWMSAVERDPQLGGEAYSLIAYALLEAQEFDRAQAYFEDQAARVGQDERLSVKMRLRLLEAIEFIQQKLAEQAAQSSP